MNYFGLPRRFWWSHHLAFMMHDILAGAIALGEQAELFQIRFPVTEADRKAIDIEFNGDIVEWLRTSGKLDEANALTERVLVQGLLFDMCQFLFESIESAAKGKLGVAFALLRKPCRDQLFLLEWILVDRDGFMNKFAIGPEKIDLCALLKNESDWMKDVSKTACEHSALNQFNDFQLLWELRFDKATEWSLEGTWNRAIHLVTTNQHYRTSTGNLNFTFLDDDARNDLTEEYYKTVPLLLVHILGVVRAVFSRWNKDFRCVGPLFDLRLAAAFSLSQQEYTEDHEELLPVREINEFILSLDLLCQSCNSPLKMKAMTDLEHFVVDLLVRCEKCRHLDSSLIELEDHLYDLPESHAIAEETSELDGDVVEPVM